MDFNNKMFEWTNEGTEPSESLKQSGFQGGYRPPASVFNRFWHLVTNAITELQTNLGSHAEDTANPHSVTKSQVGLGNVNNTADSDKSVKYATSAGSATSATKATQDSAGQQINTTYIKGLSVSGQTITYTKGDGTTGTIITQDTNTNTDTNTTYSLSKSGTTITLTGSDGSTTSVTDADTNTTYSLSSFGITATASELNALDGITATVTELNYMDGVTSNVQTQLNNKAASSHTHSYAGASSAGGAATSANKLNTDAGDSDTPVYFSSGVPVSCTGYLVNSDTSGYYIEV